MSQFARYVGKSGLGSRLLACSSSSGSHRVQQQPLKETNRFSWHEREVSVRMRKLDGKIARKGTRAVTTVVAVGNPEKAMWTARKLAHWGVQIGPYLWEAQADNDDLRTLSMQRLAGDDIWDAKVAVVVVGKTRLSDSRIERAGEGKNSPAPCENLEVVLLIRKKPRKLCHR
jgi:hypothetical protein